MPGGLVRRTSAYLLGLGGSALCTVLLRLSPWESRLDTAALLYLSVVVAAAFVGGIWPGAVTAIVAFLFMNHNFIPPTGGLTVTHPGDVMAAAAFLGVAGLVSQLLARSQREAAVARRREHEAQTISEMVQITGQTERLVPMLEAVTRWTVENLGVARSTALLPGSDGALQPAATSGIPVPDEAPSPAVSDAPQQAMSLGTAVWVDLGPWRHGLLPLLVKDEALGVLEVIARAGSEPPIWGQERIWMALVRQVGLAVERAHLHEEATEAEILRRSDEVKSVLLATVSHELGTPLAVIKAAATGLMADGMAAQPSVLGELAGSIEVEADRLGRLVTDLLDVSRIEGGALRLSLGWYDIAEFLQEAVARLRPRLGGRRVLIEAPEDLLVEFDYSLIDRVIDNLVSNALRYTPADRPVTIDVCDQGQTVEVVVSDEGPGIPDGELIRVFEKFHHIEGRAGGIGLGLAICKGIVEGHGGSIWAASPAARGNGLAVLFSLPVQGNRSAFEPPDDPPALEA